MSFSGNNQSIFNAAYNGALGGFFEGRVSADPVAADYSQFATVALAYAQAVDAAIPTDAELSTGAAGTTIAPGAGTNAAAAYAKTQLMVSLSRAFWSGRLPSDIVSADYALIALTIKAQYVEFVAGYASAPGGSSLT